MEKFEKDRCFMLAKGRADLELLVLVSGLLGLTATSWLPQKYTPCRGWSYFHSLSWTTVRPEELAGWPSQPAGLFPLQGPSGLATHTKGQRLSGRPGSFLTQWEPPPLPEAHDGAQWPQIFLVVSDQVCCLLLSTCVSQNVLFFKKTELPCFPKYSEVRC